MPTGEVTLALTDWTGGNNGKKLELPNVPLSTTIFDVKKLILKELNITDKQPDTILLFIGSLHLENEKPLREYNRSNRSKLNVDIYERVDLNLRVKTLQHSGAGGCVCVPIWAFLCRQTIHIDIPDHKTVGDLKKQIVEELNDPDRYNVENLKVTFNNKMLFDDKQVLKDLGLQKDSTLTLFVECCYWRRARRESIGSPSDLEEGTGSNKQGSAPVDSGSQDDDAANEQHSGTSESDREGRSEKPSGKEE